MSYSRSVESAFKETDAVVQTVSVKMKTGIIEVLGYLLVENLFDEKVLYLGAVRRVVDAAPEQIKLI